MTYGQCDNQGQAPPVKVPTAQTYIPWECTTWLSRSEVTRSTTCSNSSKDGMKIPSWASTSSTSTKWCITPRMRQFSCGSWPKWHNGWIIISKATSLKTWTTETVCVNLVTEDRCIQITGNDCLVFITTMEHSYLEGRPYWIQPDECGQAWVPIRNIVPVSIYLLWNEAIGTLEKIDGTPHQEIWQYLINAVTDSSKPGLAPDPK